ncbi:MAG: head GIN domain-containing protein [Janthinobacterium lividum]
MKPIRNFSLMAFVLMTFGTFTYAELNRPHRAARIETQNRNVSGFHGISSSGSFDIVLKQGNTEAVKVEADAEVINEIVTEVKGGTLEIHSKNTHNWGNFWNNRQIRIYVTAKNLNSIALSGSGDIRIEDQLNANDLELRLSGSGDFNGAINAKTVAVSISGSGDFKISGKAEESTVGISGSGDFNAGNLMTKSTAIRVSGSGDANVYASEKLDAVVNGSGDVHYGGHPKSVSKSAHGSGDISGS